MAKADHNRLYELIGDKISRARAATGMSQTKLAKTLQLSRVSIVNIEAGRQRTPVHVLWDIAEVLGIRIEQLIPAASEVADGPAELQLDTSTIKQIQEAAKNDPTTRRRLTEFIQRAKSKIEQREQS